MPEHPSKNVPPLGITFRGKFSTNRPIGASRPQGVCRNPQPVGASRLPKGAPPLWRQPSAACYPDDAGEILPPHPLGVRVRDPPTLAGLGGLEPPTPGFGDRCSSLFRATDLLLARAVERMFPAVPTELLKLKLRSPRRLKTRSVVVVLALAAAQAQVLPHAYSNTLVTTPAPTVCPPSRIANLRFSSIAIGVIRATSRFTLSPGMTISTSFRVQVPVTSVVRR